MDYSRGIAYDYAAATERKWDRLMEQEDRDTERAEARSPKVWKPEDGHAFVESTWDSIKGCIKCGHHRFAHVEEKS